MALQRIEPILSGNLPPAFDSATLRRVYVGNIHPHVREPLLQEVSLSTGPIQGCKLIKKDKTSYLRPLAFVTLNGRAYVITPFLLVMLVSVEVTDTMLFACFSVYSTCSQIRCNWAAKAATSSDDKPGSNAKSTVEMTDGASGEIILVVEIYCQSFCETVAAAAGMIWTWTWLKRYMKHSIPRCKVDLHRHFHNLGVGAIEDVHVQRVFMGQQAYSTRNKLCPSASTSCCTYVALGIGAAGASQAISNGSYHFLFS
ncbi:hypothetical protein V6N13_098012 [Hibiscus sabdariffa]